MYNWCLIATNKKTGDYVVIGPFKQHEDAQSHAEVHFKGETVECRITTMYPPNRYRVQQRHGEKAVRVRQALKEIAND